MAIKHIHTISGLRHRTQQIQQPDSLKMYDEILALRYIFFKEQHMKTSSITRMAQCI